MANEQSARSSTPDGDHIDIDNEREVSHWAEKLDTTADQIKAAVQAVGNLAADVEMHLKGTHSTTNADQQERSESAAKPH